MASVRYARPRLLTTNDKHYRAFVEQFLVQRQNQRAIRPPRQRDIFGGQAENALRTWLAGQLSLSERRILAYEEQRGKRATIKYRELDALVLEEPRTAWVFEIKASQVARSLRRAVGQLQETRAILRLLYPTVYTTILLVDTGIPTAEEVAERMAGPEPPPSPPQTLAEALAALPEIRLSATLAERSEDSTTIDLVRFQVEDIIALVGAEHLALDWEADELMEDIQPPPPGSGPAYSIDDNADTEEESPLAAALRRAGLQHTDE